MPATRLQAETILVGADKLSGRCGRRMVFAKLYDAAAATLGAIPALSGPITSGLRAAGVEPLDPTSPTDADVAAVAAAGQGLFEDVAELRCLESILGNWDEFDEQTFGFGLESQLKGRFADSLLAAIKDKREAIRTLYGYGLAPLAAGSIALDYASEPGRGDEFGC